MKKYPMIKIGDLVSIISVYGNEKCIGTVEEIIEDQAIVSFENGYRAFTYNLSDLTLE